MSTRKLFQVSLNSPKGPRAFHDQSILIYIHNFRSGSSEIDIHTHRLSSSPYAAHPPKADAHTAFYTAVLRYVPQSAPLHLYCTRLFYSQWLILSLLWSAFHHHRSFASRAPTSQPGLKAEPGNGK